MEDESRTWTLDEAPGLLQSRRSILQATWDTMGWIYFREGKVGEAESYVKASWTGRQSAEVGKHLGEIAEAKGDKAGALRDYLLALDTYPKYDAMGVHAGPPAAAKDLQDRIAALTKAGVKSASVEGGVQKLRMIPIGAAAGLNGVAEYRILVSGDAIVKAKPSGEKRLVGGEERLLKTKLAGFIPPASKANLAYTVMLNCHSGVCEVVIEQ